MDDVSLEALLFNKWVNMWAKSYMNVKEEPIGLLPSKAILFWVKLCKLEEFTSFMSLITLGYIYSLFWYIC